MRLEALQRAMVEAIEKGPGFVTAQDFAGGREATLRGLAVHANTISHARLVALEETYPRTRDLIGQARFNALSRNFVQRAEALCEPLDTIGRAFAAFLDASDAAEETVALCAFEWAWLEAYHAADAEALELSRFAGMDEETLLATRVALHPAARLAPALAAPALENEIPGLSDAAAILVTRPDATVLLSPASKATVRQFALLEQAKPLCNLLAVDDEQPAEDGLRALKALIQAGSLVLTD